MEEITKKKSLSLSEIIHDLQALEDFFKAETGGSVPMCIPEAIKVLNAIKEENDDLISREALKEAFHKDIMGGLNWKSIIDNAPPVEPKKEIVPVCNVTFDKEQLQEIVDKAIKGLQWIPITMRPIEEDEKIDFPDATFMFDCPMPENGEEILITTKYGVEFDTCYNDDGYYLDSNKSWDEVFAWMPLPEAYKKGNDEK